MRAATKTRPFHLRQQKDHETIALVIDAVLSHQEQRSRRIGIAIGIAATALLINGIVVTTLF